MIKKSIINKNRLFVPLKTEAFNWFKMGKLWEIRRLNKGQYNLNNIYIGREVELRKGYNGESLWGKLIDVKVFKNSNELTDNIDFKELIPIASTKDMALNLINLYIDNKEEIITFKIEFNDEK